MVCRAPKVDAVLLMGMQQWIADLRTSLQLQVQ